MFTRKDSNTSVVRILKIQPAGIWKWQKISFKFSYTSSEWSILCLQPLAFRCVQTTWGHDIFQRPKVNLLPFNSSRSAFVDIRMGPFTILSQYGIVVTRSASLYNIPSIELPKQRKLCYHSHQLLPESITLPSHSMNVSSNSPKTRASLNTPEATQLDVIFGESQKWILHLVHTIQPKPW